jgi:hypothetical protein
MKKILKVKHPDLDHAKLLEEFFFRAMLNRIFWTGSDQCQEGDLRLEETRRLVDKNRLVGSISIWENKVCVWEMQFDSMIYCEADLQLLKRAYFHAYATNQFIGGRGKSHDQEPGDLSVYENRPFPGWFGKFGGIETVHTVPEKWYGSKYPVTTLIAYSGGLK